MSQLRTCELNLLLGKLLHNAEAVFVDFMVSTFVDCSWSYVPRINITMYYVSWVCSLYHTPQGSDLKSQTYFFPERAHTTLDITFVRTPCLILTIISDTSYHAPQGSDSKSWMHLFPERALIPRSISSLYVHLVLHQQSSRLWCFWLHSDSLFFLVLNMLVYESINVSVVNYYHALGSMLGRCLWIGRSGLLRNKRSSFKTSYLRSSTLVAGIISSIGFTSTRIGF